jgi:hypothetical protein
MLLTSLEMSPIDFEAATGWAAKPEGMCKGDVCVPVDGATSLDGLVNVSAVAERLGMALVESPDGLWALGPESGGRALTTTLVPSIVLPDLNGNAFDLATLRGRKVVLVAWASW